jgi:flagellar export protein FliJ
VSARHDRGLHAVARVREVRERDSLLGLHRAREEHEAALERADRLGELVRTHADQLQNGAGGVTSGDWAARRTALMALAAGASSARTDADAASTVRTVATEHWQHDRSRLRAVETLLERRAEARRAERERLLARELDDLGAQRWLRGAREAQEQAPTREVSQ